MDKIKLTQKELDENYEVEQDLTQPKIEDNIDNKEQEEHILTQEEQEHDKLLSETLNWDEEKLLDAS